MSNSLIITIVLVFALGMILAGYFYWFQYRPSIIRMSCEAFAGSKSGISARFNNLYRQCLVRHGMQPESIVVR